MKKQFIISILICIIIACSSFLNNHDAGPAAKTAVVKSLGLLQQSSHVFFGNSGCYSCHGQSLPSVVVSAAKAKGIAVNDSLEKESIESMISVYQKPKIHAMLIEGNKITGGNITMGYVLWSLSSSQYPGEKATAITVHRLLQRQDADGHWYGGNGRPPLEYYAITATALVVKGIQDYSTPGMQPRVNQAVKNAREWLTKTTAPANEEKVFQLLGLYWTKAPPSVIKEKARVLLSKQQSNGGWSQLETLETDAYATGQALYALHQSNMLKTSDAAYQKGIEYLMGIQHKDGSWLVQSRTHPFQPPIVSGFPFDSNQFISAAGSSWATLALLESIE
jgi:hypothetical protein